MINYLPPKELEFGEQLRKLYPEKFTQLADVKTITFQVTENCCLNCSYCYQVHAANADMDFDTMKPFIDDLLNDRFEAATTKNTQGVIWEFIGGEPFMMIDLITQITDYIFDTMTEKNHPWLFFSRVSISTNGILYFDPRVQAYLNKYDDFIGLGISLDGSKELHDACRLDLYGQGSYDRVIKAVHHYKKTFRKMPTIKMTFSPENIRFLYESYLSVIGEGYVTLFGNCVYEEGWTEKDATILYYELKKLADYLVDNDLYNKIYISFFEETFFNPMKESEDENWCGGVDCSMISVDCKGNLYHCIRYMESSLQGDQPPLIIGDIKNGIGKLPHHKAAFESTCGITRRTQSTDECFYCPIARGCAWCSAYNYQVTGSANKRVTYICVMHKARALANVYFWNRVYEKAGVDKHFVNHLPDNQSLLIIPEEELNLLKKLEKGGN